MCEIKSLLFEKIREKEHAQHRKKCLQQAHFRHDHMKFALPEKNTLLNWIGLT